MARLQMWVSQRFFVLMYLLVAGSFVGLVGELILTEHWDGIQLVGLLAAAAGLLLAALSLFASARLRTVLAALFVLLSISGIVGTVEHNEERSTEAVVPVIMAATVGSTTNVPRVQLQDEESEEPGEREEGDGEGEAIPPLAPLSLAGMSIIGAVTLLADDRR